MSPGLIDLKGIDARGRSISECAYRIVATIRPDIHARIHRQHVAKKFESTAERSKIKLSEIKPGPKVREQLPERDVLRLFSLHACFVEIMNDSLDDWIDSFCRDWDYEREIRVWERMATCYLRCLANKKYDKDTKRVIFGLLLGFFSGADSEDLRKGFHRLGPSVGKRLHDVLEEWLKEWGKSLKYVVERELSDDEEVRRLLDQLSR